MRHRPQALFWDQLTGGTANAIGPVFDPDECGFQLLDKLFLPAGQLVELD